MSAEQHHVAPGSRGRKLVLQGEMTSATEVEVEGLEGGCLEDTAQPAQRVLPGLRFLRPVPACKRLELGNQPGAVVLDPGSKALDRDQHAGGI